MVCQKICLLWSCLTQARGLKFVEESSTPRAPSCLTQARGLKSVHHYTEPREEVVPHAGTWIEILDGCRGGALLAVVPHAGTWIEIRASRTTLRS